MNKRVLAFLLVASLILGSVICTDSIDVVMAAEVENTEESTEESTEIEESSEELLLNDAEVEVDTEVLEETTEDEVESEKIENKNTELEGVEEDVDISTPTGYLAPEVTYVLETDESDFFNYDPDQECYTSSQYNIEWDKYSTNYYYNMMSDEEKEFWEALDAMCLQYLTGTMDIDGYTSYVTSGSIVFSKDEMQEFAMIFRISNPQYYFLSNSFSFSGYRTSSGEFMCTGLSYGVYSAFNDGTDRKNATTAVKSQLDSWVNQLEACSSDDEKAKEAHDLILEKVEYNNAIYEVDFDEDTQYSQSAYSVLCTDLTVCAGYSQAYTMLCNGAGVDTISVTSENHQWNKVRINDSWYNVDCTWDDQTSIIYLYFGRNDTYFHTDTSHIEEDFWNEYLPSCTMDVTGASYYNVGTFPDITQTTATPSITVSEKSGVTTITLSCTTSNAIIYYTLDGTVPSVASTKCYLYTNTFELTKNTKISAIAVCDGYNDSVKAQKTYKASTYTITYNLRSGTNSSSNPSTYTYTTKTITLANASKKGYTFVGWYSDSACTKKVTEIKKGSTGNKTLYAKWTAIKYTIKFDANNSKATGKMSDMSSCKYDTNYTLTANAYKRTGYSFNGWNTKADGSGKAYANKTSIKNLSSKSGGNVTLYAQWKKIKYTISYNLRDGKNNSSNPATYTYTTTITLANPTKKGYTFVGWYSDSKCTKKVTEIKKGSTGNKTLYAKWKKNK